MVQLGLPSGIFKKTLAALAVMASPFLSDQMTLSESAKICRMAKKCKFVMNVHF
jgi:hypothetical protein